MVHAELPEQAGDRNLSLHDNNTVVRPRDRANRSYRRYLGTPHGTQVSSWNPIYYIVLSQKCVVSERGIYGLGASNTVGGITFMREGFAARPTPELSLGSGTGYTEQLVSDSLSKVRPPTECPSYRTVTIAFPRARPDTCIPLTPRLWPLSKPCSRGSAA